MRRVFRGSPGVWLGSLAMAWAMVACDSWKKPAGGSPAAASDATADATPDEVAAATTNVGGTGDAEAPSRPAAGDGAEPTRPSQGGDPAVVDAEAPKFDPAAGLAASLGVASLELTDDGLGETLEPVAYAGVFAIGDKRVGAAWYEVEVDGHEAVAMVHTESLDELYEAVFTHATVFLVREGAWKPVGKSAFREDDGSADYASLPTPLDLGGGHHALVHAPAITGCGAAPCKPSDDYVESTVHEVTATGLVERARFTGPGCDASDEAPQMAGCTVYVEGATDDERGTLVFAAKDSPSKPLKKHTYTYSGETYAKG